MPHQRHLTLTLFIAAMTVVVTRGAAAGACRAAAQ